MRKSEMKQKNETCRQMELFGRHGEGLTGGTTGGTGAGPLDRAALLSVLERQRTLTENLMERIVDYGNLKRAYERVRENGGGSGTDGMEVEELREWLGKNINALRTALLGEQYKVEPVRMVEIPKPEGGKRVLGIPTVRDRMIQQAIQQELSCYYDPLFSESSYGFRPGRSAHQAILRAAEYVKEGREWVVDIDLEKFFDKINHDRLMQRLSKGIGDKRLLRLIRAYLQAGMMHDGLVEQRTAGTPQGGPLSPLLSNIVLDELDKELERRSHNFCRYADDCNIYVRSRKAGERVMSTIIDFIEKKLKLKVNREKSGVRHCSDVKFLGYTIMPEGGIRASDKAIDRLRDKIREITRRNRGSRLEEVIKELNITINGWANYYKLSNTWLTNFKGLDGWIRRKVRCYRLKQCGRRYTIFKFLRSLGVPEKSSWNAIMYSQGWWELSNKYAIKNSMNLGWFALLGLQSLSLKFNVKS